MFLYVYDVYIMLYIRRCQHGFIVFKVITLNFTTLMVLHPSKFGLGFSSVADFLNTGARAPNLAECTLCLLAQRAIRIELEPW